MGKYEEEDATKKVLMWISVGLIAVVLIFVLNPIVIVGAGERGVIMNWGAVQDYVWGEGMHFKMPIMQDIHIMDVRTQKYVVTAKSASSDLQDVSTEVALNYHVDAGKVNKIYQTIGSDFADRIISPAVQECVKAGTAQYTAEQLITKRPEAKNTIDLCLGGRLAEYGIVVDTISITNFQFSEQFTTAIEAKVTAEQSALQAQNKLKQIEFEAQQKVTTATAEATAIKIQGDALRSNPEVVSLRWIEKWDGKMPIVWSGGQSMIMDISTLFQKTG